ncbi:MAG TPA: DUF1697 domain-containing protein [Solirubrobacteraceae bacterium]|jgi:uncharacterized protein (DUF1697 family)|nr:DUF1697 domain-containing protein [Solirubrobacteraceae bacterium]
MPAQIALLRGINVGSHNRIPMAELRDLLSELGYGDARTLVQSGNIVLSSDASPEQLERKLEQEIAGRFGVETPVIVRTRDELAAVVERDPWGDLAADQPKLYQVSFLSEEPDPEAMRNITAVEVSPERLVLVGREIYAWHPGGIQRSKLARLLSDKRLGVTATARNWNTTTKLLEMADELES